MKKYLPFLLVLFLTGCYTAQVARFEPYNPPNVLDEQGKKFAYENNDSIIVSVASYSFLDGVYSLDVTIDNQSGHQIVFKPKDVYLLRYNTDTSLGDQKLYFAINPQQDIDSINQKINQQQDKLVSNTFFSILIGVAFVAANVAAFDNEGIAQSMEAIDATYDVAQMSLYAARAANQEKINVLSCEKEHILNTSLDEIVIEPGDFAGGILRFYVPYSDFYKIYLSVNNRIFRFTFKGI